MSNIYTDTANEYASDKRERDRKARLREPGPEERAEIEDREQTEQDLRRNEPPDLTPEEIAIDRWFACQLAGYEKFYDPEFDGGYDINEVRAACL